MQICIFSFIQIIEILKVYIVKIVIQKFCAEEKCPASESSNFFFYKNKSQSRAYPNKIIVIS